MKLVSNNCVLCCRVMDEFYSYPHAARAKPIHMNLTNFILVLNKILKNPRYKCRFAFPKQYIIQKYKLKTNSPHLDTICDLFSMVVWQICTNKPNVHLTRQLRSLLDSMALAKNDHTAKSHRWFQMYFGFLGAAVYCLENRCFCLMGKRSRFRSHKNICMLKTLCNRCS